MNSLACDEGAGASRRGYVARFVAREGHWSGNFIDASGAIVERSWANLVDCPKTSAPGSLIGAFDDPSGILTLGEKFWLL